MLLDMSEPQMIEVNTCLECDLSKRIEKVEFYVLHYEIIYDFSLENKVGMK